MFGLGIVEIGVVVIVALLFFGPSRLPQFAKSLGGAIRNFRAEVSGRKGA